MTEFLGKTELIQYYKCYRWDVDKIRVNTPRSIFYAMTLDSINNVYIGISQCHNRDKFDKELGKRLAKERANLEYCMIIPKYRIHVEDDIYLLPDESAKDYNIIIAFIKFMERCRKVFKGKNIVFPNVDFIIEK